MNEPRKILEVKYYTGKKLGLTTITNTFYTYSDDDIKWANEIHELAEKYMHKSILKRMKEYDNE